MKKNYANDWIHGGDMNRIVRCGFKVTWNWGSHSCVQHTADGCEILHQLVTTGNYETLQRMGL